MSESIKAFTNYATQNAFSVSLSKCQIAMMKRIQRQVIMPVEKIGKHNFERFDYVGKLQTQLALVNKGLIEDIDGNYHLSSVGIMVMALVDVCKLEGGTK